MTEKSGAVVSRAFNAITGSIAVVVVLLALVAVSVSLACIGGSAASKVALSSTSLILLTALAIVLSITAFLSIRRVSVFFLHFGFALVVSGWVVNAWMHKSGCVPENFTIRLSPDGEGCISDHGSFRIALRDFRVDTWPDTGTVRQYTSSVSILCSKNDKAADKHQIDTAVSVNHPARYQDWWIYQSGCGMRRYPGSDAEHVYTELSFVKDLGLPMAAAGGLFLVLGAFFLAANSFRKAVKL